MKLCDVCALKLVDAKLTEPLFKIIPDGKSMEDAEYKTDPKVDKCENCGKPATMIHPQASKEKFGQLADKKKQQEEAKKENNKKKLCPLMGKDCVEDKCMAWKDKDCRYMR